MNELNLDFIYTVLKDKYALILTNAFSLNAGFLIDCKVLYGQSSSAKFYLYHDGAMAIFDIENNEGTLADHWHPENTAEAMQNVVDFMEENCEFDGCSMENI